MGQDIKSIIDRYKAAMFTVDRRLNTLVGSLLPEDLTIDQYHTISYIRAQKQCKPSELAEFFCVGKSSITAIVNRLFDKLWIQRIPDDKDRRVVYLSVTEEGERLVDAVDSKVEVLLKKYLNRFTEEEAMRFIETFEKLGRVLQEQDREEHSDR